MTALGNLQLVPATPDHAKLLFDWRNDAGWILSQLSISVLPSLSEGLSNVLIESLAAGVPTVATTVGGNGEVVDDGVT